MSDLSEYHEPVGRLFPGLNAQKDWNEYHLSADQVAFFHENGYLSGIKLLSDEQCDVLLEELDDLMRPDHPQHALFYEFHSNESSDPNTVLFHSLGHWRISPGFHDVLWNPPFVVAASQLLGGKAVRFWHDQLFCKPARHGGVVAWHQDYSYWTRSKPMQHLTCWVALDDTTLENGCLQYVPGSHRWGLLDRPELAGDMLGLEQYLSIEQKRQFDTKVAIELKRGYATFHHPLMVHGSYANTSDRSRRAFVINVFADGTYSDVDEPLLAGVPAFKRGEKLSGKFFPLLFDPS